MFANTTGGLVLSRAPIDPSLVARYGWKTSLDVAAATRLQVYLLWLYLLWRTLPLTLTLPLTPTPTLPLTLPKPYPYPYPSP